MYSHCIRIVVPLSSLVGRDDEDVGYGCCLGISNTACTVLLHTVTCRSVAGYRNVQHYEQTNQRRFYACFACSSPQLYVHCHSMRTHMCCRVAQTSAGVCEPCLSRSLASIAFNLSGVIMPFHLGQSHIITATVWLSRYMSSWFLWTMLCSPPLITLVHCEGMILHGTALTILLSLHHQIAMGYVLFSQLLFSLLWADFPPFSTSNDLVWPHSSSKTSKIGNETNMIRLWLVSVASG